jgi:hypothetical protein
MTLFATDGREHRVVAAMRAVSAHMAAILRPCAMDRATCHRFITGISESLPEAEASCDRFHVARVSGDAVEGARRSEWHRDKTVQRSRFVLLTNPEDRTDHLGLTAGNPIISEQRT